MSKEFDAYAASIRQLEASSPRSKAGTISDHNSSILKKLKLIQRKKEIYGSLDSPEHTNFTKGSKKDLENIIKRNV